MNQPLVAPCNEVQHEEAPTTRAQRNIQGFAVSTVLHAVWVMLPFSTALQWHALSWWVLLMT